jgi:ABC-2 type transport system ATP-binding protein
MVLEPGPSSELVARLRDIQGVTDVVAIESAIKVTLAGAREAVGQVVTLVTKESRLVGFDQHQPSLDEVFLHLTGRELRD